MMKKLIFKVTDQKIIWDKSVHVVTDTQNYITAEFEFSQEWADVTKTAIFKGTSGTYSVLLNDNACIIPHEVLTSGFSVSVYGVSGNMRITSDSVYINAVKSGYEDGETPSDPTPTVYEEILGNLSDIKHADGERAEQIKKNTDDIAAVQADTAKKADKTAVEEVSKTVKSNSNDINNIQSNISNICDNIDVLEQNMTLKVDKIEGKTLSSNDYTDDDKSKLDELPTAEQMLGLFEEKANKVTSITMDSTDTQYPSALAVWDLVAPVGYDLFQLKDQYLPIYLSGKVDKIDGKGLSSNDYTDEEKSKLAELNNYDDTEIRQANAANTADIQELKNNNAVIKAEIANKSDKIKSIPHTDVTGYPLTITDQLADEKLISLKIYGSTGGIGEADENGKYKIPIKITGKNLFDISKVNSFVTGDYATKNNYSSISDGIVTSNTGIWANRAVWYDSKIKLPAGTYTISADCMADKDTGDKNVRLMAFDLVRVKNLGENRLLSAYKTWERLSVNFTLEDECEIAILIQGVGVKDDYKNLNIKIKNVQLERTDSDTAYEPYSESVAEAVLDSPLSDGEFIDIIAKKRYFSNGETENITVEGEIKFNNSEKNYITCETATAPSKLEISYFQDINKVLAELKNAILSQGGNV